MEVKPKENNMPITQETFDALVAHFAEYRECNPSPLDLANMAIDTLGISIAQEDKHDEIERDDHG